MTDSSVTPAGEMTRIVALLSEVYTDDGVAMALTGRNAHVSRDVPLIEVCRNADGRAQVLAWAESLAEGNFS